MSNALEWLEKLRKNQEKYHSERIKTVLTSDIPQHILATKEVAAALTVGEDGYTKTEAGLFFKEKLVNRLMYLSYLHGTQAIDERSFAQGWDKAIDIMREKLVEL